MNNYDTKIYKGAVIQKQPKGKWTLNNRQVAGYNEAKQLVDEEIAEHQALKDIDNYVVDVCGGWL